MILLSFLQRLQQENLQLLITKLSDSFFGVIEESDFWRIKKNKEIRCGYKDPDTSETIKIARTRLNKGRQQKGQIDI